MKQLMIVAALLVAAPAQAADQAAILAEYQALLAIPNVATNVADIRRNADHIMAMMARRGLAPRLLEGDNAKVPPAIYGEWLVPGAKRTLVLYAHYDGQPVTPEDWKSTQPFEPKLYSDRLDRGGKAIRAAAPPEPIDPNWRIYARSASDDKLGVMAILAAVDALKAQGKRPAYNLKIFFDGEEEAGSPNLAALLAKHRDTLKSDGWVIFDGPAHPTGAAAGLARRARRRQCRRHRPRPGAPAAQRPLRQLGAQPGDDAEPAAGVDEGRATAG